MVTSLVISFLDHELSIVVQCDNLMGDGVLHELLKLFELLFGQVFFLEGNE